MPRSAQESPDELRRSAQNGPEQLRRAQGSPGELSKSSPGQPNRAQGGPGEPKRAQESAEELRRARARPNERQQEAMMRECDSNERPIGIKTDPREGQQRPKRHDNHESIASEAYERMGITKVQAKHLRARVSRNYSPQSVWCFA